MQETITRLRDKKKDDGFTLIELLVVVVIIGVLVAIAVPVYLNYRQGANDKSAQSDLRGAISTIEQYYTNNSNTYPADIAATQGTSGKVTLTAQTDGTDGVVTLSSGTTFQLKNKGSYYVICTGNDGGSSQRFYSYNSRDNSSVQSVKVANIAACMTAAGA